MDESGFSKSCVKHKKIFTYERVRLGLAIVFGSIFVGTAILGLTNKYHGIYTEAQAKLVVIQNGPCMLIVLVPYFLEKVFGLRADIKMLVFLYMFAICGVTLGEGCKLYYTVGYWDKILHTVSGGLQFYIFFALANVYIKNSDIKHKFAAAAIFAFLGSMAFAALWEVMEFVTDTINGANAQKFIPLTDDLFNGGDSRAPLAGTAEEIAEFYKNPSGYRYALMDTMTDICVCLAGTLIMFCIMNLVAAFKKDAFDNGFIYDKKLSVFGRKAESEVIQKL